MAKGIYKITNDRTGELYVGQAKNLDSRWDRHLRELANGNHHNIGMQKDYDRGDTFSFEVLEELPNATKADLYNKEAQYVKKYNCFREGYNQTPGGAMDQFKGKYEYGGGRLPVEKYKHLEYSNIVKNREIHVPNSIENNEVINSKMKLITILGFIFSILSYFSFTSFPRYGYDLMSIPFAILALACAFYIIFNKQSNFKIFGIIILLLLLTLFGSSTIFNFYIYVFVMLIGLIFVVYYIIKFIKSHS